MAKFKDLDEILEVAEDPSLVTAAYNLAIEKAVAICRAKYSEWSKRNAHWQHHTGAALGADRVGDEIEKLRV